MTETSAAPRASTPRPPRRVRLTRLVTILVFASTVGALSSVATAGLAISSFLESRHLRTQIEATRIGVPGGDRSVPYVSAPAAADASSTSSSWFAEPDTSAWDNLPESQPLIIIGREDLEDALTDDLATSARIVPAFQNGHSVGFKLFSIRPNSFYALMLRLQNGDVIRRINGMAIKSPEAALEAYSKLRDAKQLRVDVERRGEPLRLDFIVQ